MISLTSLVIPYLQTSHQIVLNDEERKFAEHLENSPERFIQYKA